MSTTDSPTLTTAQIIQLAKALFPDPYVNGVDHELVEISVDPTTFAARNNGDNLQEIWERRVSGVEYFLHPFCYVTTINEGPQANPKWLRLTLQHPHEMPLHELRWMARADLTDTDRVTIARHGGLQQAYFGTTDPMIVSRLIHIATVTDWPPRWQETLVTGVLAAAVTNLLPMILAFHADAETQAMQQSLGDLPISRLLAGEMGVLGQAIIDLNLMGPSFAALASVIRLLWRSSIGGGGTDPADPQFVTRQFMALMPHIPEPLHAAAANSIRAAVPWPALAINFPFPRSTDGTPKNQ